MASTASHSEKPEIGRVTTTAKVTNILDLNLVDAGRLPESDVRRVELELLVDSGETMVLLPVDVIEQLGLKELSRKRVMTSADGAERNVFSAVRLVIMDRDATLDVLEIPLGEPARLGRAPLAMLDLVPNPETNRLVGNPDHDGKYILDQL